MKEVEHEDGRKELVLLGTKSTTDVKEKGEEGQSADVEDERPGVVNVVSSQSKYDLSRRRVDFTDADKYITWLNNETIPAIVAGCPGDCKITLRGPMIEVWNCTETSRYVNYTQKLAGNLTWTQQLASPELVNRTAFYTAVDIEANSAEREFLWVETGISDQNATDTCGGHFTTKSDSIWFNLKHRPCKGDVNVLSTDNSRAFYCPSCRTTYIGCLLFRVS